MASGEMPNLARLRASGGPEGQPALVVIAHGSRFEAANQEIIDLCARLQTGGLDRVYPAFLELAEPTIPQAGEAAATSGARWVVLCPYFLSAGRHVTTDLEDHRQALARRHAGIEFLLAPPLGPDPMLDRLLIERAAAVVASVVAPR